MEIDLVITWVDGQDPAWRRRFEQALSQYSYEFPSEEFEVRYDSYDDLSVCLKSAEVFAPGLFRKIWVVHDAVQKPAISAPGVECVSHEDIMPPEILPTFNSLVIEAYLHRIPGLAEHFVYANDDFFFREPVSGETFFDGVKPKVYASRPVPPLDEVLSEEIELNGWRLSLAYTNTLLNRVFTPDQAPDQYLRIHPAHVHVPMTREIGELSWKYFGNELRELSSFRFRPLAVFERKLIATLNMLFPWVGLETGRSVLAGKPEELRCTYPKLGPKKRRRALAPLRSAGAKDVR